MVNASSIDGSLTKSKDELLLISKNSTHYLLIKEFNTLSTKCIEDAQSARKDKGRTRYFYFAFGIDITPTKLNTALIESDEDPHNLNEEPIDFCKRRIVTHLKEFNTLSTKCIEDAQSARKDKGRTRYFYFALGIFVALLGAVTTSFTAIKTLPAIEGNTNNRPNMEIAGIVISTLSTLAGVGVAILSKDFDYTKFRQRAIDLKELKGELNNKCEELQLNLLKLNKDNASVDKYEELLTLLHTQKQTLEKKALNLGVGI